MAAVGLARVVLSNVMPIETAILVWIFIVQPPGAGQWMGMLVCAAGVTVVQRHRNVSGFFEARKGGQIAEEGG